MMTEEIMNNVGEATEVAMEIVPEVSDTNKLGKAGKIGGLLLAGAAIGVAVYEGGKKVYKFGKKKAEEAKEKKKAKEAEDDK